LRSQHHGHDGVRVSGAGRARIIDDQLILFSVFTATQDRGDAKILRGFLDQYGPWICNHLHTFPWPEYGSTSGLPELARNSSPPEYFASCTSSVNSCAVCITDYCIDIVQQGGAKGWAITIATYQQLGPVRYPFDCTWRVMADPCWQTERRSMHLSSYPPGIVRHRWSKADAV